MDLDKQMAIEQVMRKYRLNYSRAIGLIIDQWMRFQQDIKKFGEQKEMERKKLELEALMQSKVVKDEK